MMRPESRADTICILVGMLLSGYAIWHCAMWIATGLPGLLK